MHITRRQFLRAAAAGTAAAAASRRAQAASRPRWNMRLSTSSIHFMKLPVEEACRRIARLGFEAVDIWSAHAGCPHLDDVLERLGAEGLKRLLAETQLKLFAFSVYRGGYAKYARLLGEAGGGVAVRGSTRAPKGDVTAAMRAFLEGLKPQIELAEQYDARLAIENHGNALLNTLDSFKAFVDLNRSPRVGIALAPYHLQGSGASVEQAIEIAGDQLFFFYAWQRGKGLAQLPGHGPTDFRPWLAALAKVNYRGCVNPFMHGDVEPDEMAAALAKAKRYLEACYAEAVAG